MKIYRDGIEEEIIGTVGVRTNRDGHTIEFYRLKTGERRYFVTLAGTHWCAHGSTVAEAIADALWKDPARRPPIEKLVAKIRKAGIDRKITLREFRHITGACLIGCQDALKRAGLSGVKSMTAKDIRDKVSRDWGSKLIDLLGWKKELA